MSCYSFFFHTIPIILNSTSIVILGVWFRKLSNRIDAIENATYIRDWLQAIQDGESASDLAYMKQKGFLK